MVARRLAAAVVAHRSAEVPAAAVARRLAAVAARRLAAVAADHPLVVEVAVAADPVWSGSAAPNVSKLLELVYCGL